MSRGDSAISRFALGGQRDSGSLTDHGSHELAANMSADSVRMLSAPANLFIGEVKDDVDPQFMGRVWVFIPGFSMRSRDQDGDPNDRSKWIRVAPVFPFFGSNERRENLSSSSQINGGAPTDGFSTSYGFWGQPRVGDHLAIMFADMSVNSGYYIGAVPKYGQAFQVPGAAVDDANGETFQLPGSEIPAETNRERYAGYSLAQNLKEAGLQLDFHRGGGTATSQRESPSRVYGMKTPGSNSTDTDNTSIGHQFVMDDSPADSGIRFRTSHGHQILFSDAKDVIYVSSHKGNNWVELDGSTGNIDMYCKGSFSVHTEQDFNVTVGRNMNVHVMGEENKLVVGETHIEYQDAYHLTVTGEESDVIIKYEGEHHLTNVGQYTMSNQAGLHVDTTGQNRMTSSSTTHIKGGGEVYIDSDSNVRQQQSLAQDADTATEPDLPTKEERPGPPTTSQVQNAEGGDDVEYVAGTSESGRTPQHEPWHDVGEGQKVTAADKAYNRTRGPSSRTAIGSTDATTSGEGRLVPVADGDYQYIIVHCSASSPGPVTPTGGGRTAAFDRIKSMHVSTNHWRDIGYHWVIDRDGTVIQGRDENTRGSHVGGINRFSLGICLIGGFHPLYGFNYPDYTTNQMSALRALIGRMQGTYGIGDNGVFGHWQAIAQNGQDTTFRVAGATGQPKDCPCFDVNKWWTTNVIECTATDPAASQYRGTIVTPHAYSLGNP